MAFDLIQVVQAAQNVAPVTIELDWRTIAIAACSLIVALCSWIWVSTIGWLKRISDDFKEHVAEDNKAFTEVKKMITDSHIETIKTINRKRINDQ